MWAGFAAVVLVMLALDLGVFHRRAHAVTMKEAATWTVVWIVVSLIFNAFVFHWFGSKTALEFLTGYIVEKSLSVDNLFVFFVLFNYFRVPAQLQHRVLFWGIFGAIVIRTGFIFVGVALIQRFDWVMYVFGVILLYTAIKILFGKDEEIDPEHNPVAKLVRRFLPLTKDYREQHFLVRESGRLLATPLLLVLVVVEATDVVFAVDSIPAVLAITTDPFIVLTSNIFAILGLRALYFMIARIIDQLHYLKVGLGFVLAFISVKMLGHHHFKVPINISLSVIVGVLALSALASVVFKPAQKTEPPAGS